MVKKVWIPEKEKGNMRILLKFAEIFCRKDHSGSPFKMGRYLEEFERGPKDGREKI